MAGRSRGCLDRFRIAPCAAPIRRLVPRFLNGYRELVAAVARYNRAATRGRAFPGKVRAADHHPVRRICRFGDARNRKSDGLEFLAASAAVLSLAVGFALWSCYSDGATGWETRHMRTNKHVIQLRFWIALHFLLFLGIGILGVGARHGIALPPGGSFGATEQWLICFAGAGTMLVIMGIAATSERHISPRSGWVWLAQVAIAIFILSLGLLTSRIIATALLLVLSFCFVGQTALLLINQHAHRRIAEI